MGDQSPSSPAHAGDLPEAANLGMARPPIVYLGAIVFGLVLQSLRPVEVVPTDVGTPVGAIAVLAAIALFIAAGRSFRAAGTPVQGNRPTTTIVRSGPYRFTRNPIYLSFTLLHPGIALWVNSVWLLMTLIPALAVMSWVVIPREEAFLAARFPFDYLPYKASVRRWL